MFYFWSSCIPFITQALASFAILSCSFGSVISRYLFFSGTSNPALVAGLSFNLSHHAFRLGNSSISIPAHAAELTHPKLAISATDQIPHEDKDTNSNVITNEVVTVLTETGIKDTI